MKNHKSEFLYAGIYILLFVILFNLTIDNPLLELFRRYYWFIIGVLSLIYPVIKLKEVKIKAVILTYLLLVALTFLPELTGDAIYYYFISSADETVLFFRVFAILSIMALTVAYIAGIFIKIIFIRLIQPGFPQPQAPAKKQR